MVPTCYINQAGGSRISLLCCEGLKWGCQPPSTRSTSPQLICLAPLLFSSMKARLQHHEKLGSVHLCLWWRSQLVVLSLAGVAYAGCVLRRDFPSLLTFVPLIPCPHSKKTFGVGNYDYFGSEQCKSTTSGTSGGGRARLWRIWHISQRQEMDGWMQSCAYALPAVVVPFGAHGWLLPRRWEGAVQGGGCAPDPLSWAKEGLCKATRLGGEISLGSIKHKTFFWEQFGTLCQ